MSVGTHPILRKGEVGKVYVGQIGNDGQPVLTEGGLETWPESAGVSGATISAQIREESDDESGAALGASISMSYVSGSTGHYTGTVPKATADLLVIGTIYDVWVKGSLGEMHRRLKYECQYGGHK